ncbi:MAG TPA: ABC transporter permease [Anaerolineae bacterium]|nr:ABC transporter permease [Anaerolineae bacterium]
MSVKVMSNGKDSKVSVVSLMRFGIERGHELYAYRFLLYNLVIRDLKVRYKNSVLGVLWSLLNPLMMMVVFSLVFNILMRNDAIRQYGVFILVGLLPWNFFTGALMGGSTVIAGNANLIKKVYFPRELLPLSVILSNLVNFLLALIVLVLFLYISGLGITRYALWLPFLLMAQLIFTLGLCLFLGTMHVYYRDIVMILDVVLLAGFFLTPVFYSLDFFGDMVTVLGVTFDPAMVMRWVNPMASIIDGYRTVLWGTLDSNGAVSMDLRYFMRTLVTALLTLFLGYGFFMRHQHVFGEKL